MLKRGSGTRNLLPAFHGNNNMMPLGINTIGNNNTNNNNTKITPLVSSVASSPVHLTRSVSPALAGRSVRHLTLGTRHTANVRNNVAVAHMSHATPIGMQKLQTLRVNRRRRNARRTRSRRG